MGSERSELLQRWDKKFILRPQSLVSHLLPTVNCILSCRGLPPPPWTNDLACRESHNQKVELSTCFHFFCTDVLLQIYPPLCAPGVRGLVVRHPAQRSAIHSPSRTLTPRQDPPTKRCLPTPSVNTPNSRVPDHPPSSSGQPVCLLSAFAQIS